MKGEVESQKQYIIHPQVNTHWSCLVFNMFSVFRKKKTRLVDNFQILQNHFRSRKNKIWKMVCFCFQKQFLKFFMENWFWKQKPNGFRQKLVIKHDGFKQTWQKFGHASWLKWKQTNFKLMSTFWKQVPPFPFNFSGLVFYKLLKIFSRFYKANIQVENNIQVSKPSKKINQSNAEVLKAK